MLQRRRHTSVSSEAGAEAPQQTSPPPQQPRTPGYTRAGARSGARRPSLGAAMRLQRAPGADGGPGRTRTAAMCLVSMVRPYGLGAGSTYTELLDALVEPARGAAGGMITPSLP